MKHVPKITTTFEVATDDAKLVSTQTGKELRQAWVSRFTGPDGTVYSVVSLRGKGVTRARARTIRNWLFPPLWLRLARTRFGKLIRSWLCLTPVYVLGVYVGESDGSLTSPLPFLLAIVAFFATTALLDSRFNPNGRPRPVTEPVDVDASAVKTINDLRRDAGLGEAP